VVKFHPFLFLLGILDIVAGTFYYFKIYFFPIFLTLLLKGIWSLVLAFTSKDFLLTLMAILDITLSLFAILSISGAEILSFLIILKGIISLF